MGRTYNNTKRVCHLTITRYGKEAWRTLVHSRPEGIGTQTQHQFKKFTISLRPHIVFRPLTQTPVLIIDKNATVLHRGGMFYAEGVGQRERIRTGIRTYIAPPYPRRDTCHTRKFQQAISRTTGIMSLDNELTFLHTQAEAVIVALALHDTDGCLTRSNGLHTRYHLHIIGEHPKGLLHDRVNLAINLIADRMLPIEPYHIRGGHDSTCDTDEKKCQ